MKKSILTIILSSIFIILLTGGYYLLAGKGSGGGNPWKMIPDTPAFVFQTDNPGTLYNKLSHQNEMYKKLKGISRIENLDKTIRQFFNITAADRDLNHAVLNSPFYFADFYDSLPGRNQYLLLFQIKRSVRISRIKKIITNSPLVKGTKLSVKVVGNHKIMDIASVKTGRQYHLAVLNGVVLLSPSENLLQKALNTYDRKDNFSENIGFKEVAKTSGKIVDARLFINYSQMMKLLGKFTHSGYRPDILELSDFAQWTEADLLLKSKDLLLSGYTSSGPRDLLSQYMRKNGENTDIYSLFPFNSNISLDKAYQHFSKAAAEKGLKNFPAGYRKDMKALISISREVCYASNAMEVNNIPDKSWGAISFDDELKAETLLKRLSVSSGARYLKRYNNHIIRKINIKNLLPSLYGKIFSGTSREYYTILDGDAVFGHSPDALIRLIHYYDTGKTLDLNDNFKLFSTNMIRSSDLTFQVQLRSFLDLLSKYLEKGTADGLIKTGAVLKNFQYLILQFNKEDSMYYTNFALQYNSAYKEENLAIWKIQLNDSVVGKPFLVKDPKNGKYDIIIFDKGNRMYFISYNGKILWTKQLPSFPISRIYQVDYYHNGNIQYLFNTPNNLFLIDRKGHFVANYPIPLRPVATNGISVFDYTGLGDYRIMVAQEDEKIHDYTIKGNPVSGWANPKMPDITVQPVYRLLTHHHDYIIITDMRDHIKIVDRRGRQRIYLKGSFQKARNSAYYVNHTNNKGIILTTDKKGQLVYISRSGRISYTSFGHFSPDHYFLYEDFNGDFNKDFIYIDHKKLTVFNRFKKVLFFYSFSSNIDVQPEFFSLGGRQKVLGVVASHENTIYLFDNQGNILIGRGLTGATPFTVGSLNRRGDINLITAAGNTLYNYKIK